VQCWMVSLWQVWAGYDGKSHLSPSWPACPIIKLLCVLTMMDESIKLRIRHDFSESDYDLVLSELESITLEHVMAESQTNLDNTWNSILQLSKGDLSELGHMVEAAKADFRDVIYWAGQENEQNNT